MERQASLQAPSAVSPVAGNQARRPLALQPAAQGWLAPPRKPPRASAARCSTVLARASPCGCWHERLPVLARASCITARTATGTSVYMPATCSCYVHRPLLSLCLRRADGVPMQNQVGATTRIRRSEPLESTWPPTPAIAAPSPEALPVCSSCSVPAALGRITAESRQPQTVIV